MDTYAFEGPAQACKQFPAWCDQGCKTISSHVINQQRQYERRIFQQESSSVNMKNYFAENIAG